MYWYVVNSLYSNIYITHPLIGRLSKYRKEVCVHTVLKTSRVFSNKGFMKRYLLKVKKPRPWDNPPWGHHTPADESHNSGPTVPQILSGAKHRAYGLSHILTRTIKSPIKTLNNRGRQLLLSLQYKRITHHRWNDWWYFFEKKTILGNLLSV